MTAQVGGRGGEATTQQSSPAAYTSRLQHTPHPPPSMIMSSSSSHRTAPVVTILPTPGHQAMSSQIATRITSPVDDTTTTNSSTMPHHSSLTGSMTSSSNAPPQDGIVTLHTSNNAHDTDDLLGTAVEGDIESVDLLTTEPSSSRSEANSIHSPIRGVISVMSTRDSFRIQGMSQAAFSARRNSDSTLSADVLSSSSSSSSFSR